MDQPEPKRDIFRAPQRRQPRHGVRIQEDQPTIVLVTVCTQDRVRCLANDRTHEHLKATWAAATAWKVDHIHFFVGFGDMEIPLDNWVKYWKSQFNKTAQTRVDWQESHWDTRMRSLQQCQEKWQYVMENPVRHGLVTSSENWPYQGQMNVLTWC